MELGRVRDTFAVDETLVSTLPDADAATSQARYRKWQDRFVPDDAAPVEYLVPRVVRDIERSVPGYQAHHPGHRDLSGAELQALVDSLGPWELPFALRDGIETVPVVDDDPTARRHRAVVASRLQFRRELITATVAELLGSSLDRSAVLDLGCNAGFFSLDMAARGAQQVDGVDLRARNVAQAAFLAEHYGLANTTFSVGDAEAFADDRSWDVVLNLGLLYHVTTPLQLVRRTYELCRHFAVIDTVCHREPVSAFVLFGDKDVDRPTEGRETFELHPTYRAVIDTIRYAGFSDVYEIEGRAERGHGLYPARRRCFLAVK